MKTEIIRIFSENIDKEKIKKAAAIIRGGGLVAFPTETVYGLGGDALNAASAEKIYKAKGRPSDNPLIVHIADIADMEELARDIPDSARLLAKTYWPGPMTLVLKKRDIVPYETTGGLNTVAIRMPANKIATELIRLSETPIAAPSANLSGRPSPTRALHVQEDLFGKIEMILDGGSCIIGLESSIIDVSDGEAILLRPGAIDEEMLRNTLGSIKRDPSLNHRVGKAEKPKAPGMKYRHYAPKAELIIIKGEAEAVIRKINLLAENDMRHRRRVGILASKENADRYPFGIVSVIGSSADQESIAYNLFAVLRDFDTAGVHLIYSESFPQKGIGEAVMNRLLKAAAYRQIEV